MGDRSIVWVPADPQPPGRAPAAGAAQELKEDLGDKKLTLVEHLGGARHLCRPLHPRPCPCKAGTAPFLEEEGLSGQEGQGPGHCSYTVGLGIEPPSVSLQRHFIFLSSSLDLGCGGSSITHACP